MFSFIKKSKFLIVVCIGLIVFASVFNSGAVAQKKVTGTIQDLSQLDGYSEHTKDINGNQVKLSYEVNEERVRINSFVNDKLVDYSIVRINDGVLSDEIEHFRLNEDRYFISSQSNNRTVFKVDDFITKIHVEDGRGYEKLQSNSLQNSPSYPFIMSRYSSLYNLTGSLYGTDTITDEEVFVFDFPISTRISVIASVLLMVFNAPIGIQVTVLLAELGIAFVDSSINTYLAGYYDAQNIRWDYEVFVNDVLTLRSISENLYITYYSTSTGKSHMRIENYGDTRSRNDLIYAGIYNYHIWYEVN